MKIHFLLSGALICGSLLAILPLVAAAQDAIAVETIAGTTYLNGGIGQSEQNTMRRVAKEFPLRMTFSESKDGEFIADVQVVISDMRGNPVFELAKAGPMLDVALPNGKYKVSAQVKGLTESQEVTLDGKDGRDLHFNWKVK